MARCPRIGNISLTLESSGTMIPPPSSVLFPLHERHITAAADLLGRGRPTTVILALRARVSEIDSGGVLDLRCPGGQRELVELVRSSKFLRSKLPTRMIAICFTIAFQR